MRVIRKGPYGGGTIARIESAGIEHLRGVAKDRWIFMAETDAHLYFDDDDAKQLLTALRRRADSIARFIFKNPDVEPFASPDKGITVRLTAGKSGNKGVIQGYFSIMFTWHGSNAAAKRFGDVLAQRAYKD